MTQKMIWECYDIKYKIADTLSDIRDQIDQWISEYGPDTNLNILADEEYGSPIYVLQLEYKRPETKVETKERERQEKMVADFRVKREHEEYLKLKAKFEKSDEQSS